jgi:hypothetical protein
MFLVARTPDYPRKCMLLATEEKKLQTSIDIENMLTQKFNIKLALVLRMRIEIKRESIGSMLPIIGYCQWRKIAIYHTNFTELIKWVFLN